jgi:hypothetical protein
MSSGMQRIEGNVLVAYWLIGSSLVALGRLVAEGNDIVAHPAGSRAAVGPLVVALASLVAGWRLLRWRGGFRLGAALLGVQLVAVSAGPLAYRLDVGPFFRVGFASSGGIAGFGSGAHLLFIAGIGNHVPPGISINLLALGALVVLFATHRAAGRNTITNRHAQTD